MGGTGVISFLRHPGDPINSNDLSGQRMLGGDDDETFKNEGELADGGTGALENAKSANAGGQEAERIETESRAKPRPRFRGTNMTDDESVTYHYGKHGGLVDTAQYVSDAQEWAENPSGTSERVTLANGSEGVRYRTPGGGVGGILEVASNIITFWYG